MNNASVFFNIGLSNGFALTGSNLKERNKTFFVTQSVQRGKAILLTRSYEVGMLLGTGAFIGRFSGEVRYELGNGMSDVFNVGTITHRLYILLGVKIF